MSWIKTISYDDADDRLKKTYDKIKGPNNNVDNVLLIHSLRPHTLTGHMALYKNVLHNANNTIPKWFLESLGVYVSHLNNCSYCRDHHFAGLSRLLADEKRAADFLNGVIKDVLAPLFESKELAAFQYAKKITLSVQQMEESDVIALRNEGYSDGEILEINQVVSYFNYVNRSVVGLGVNTQGDILGLSPNDNDDPDNWSHT